MSKIKAIVWDVGGVLLTDPDCAKIWDGVPNNRELRGLFGSGDISIEDFVNQASAMVGLPEDEFFSKYENAYCHVIKNKEVCEIYFSLRYKKYILTDTNPIHLGYIRKTFPEIFNSAKEVFASPEIHLRKSMSETYKFLIKGINLPANEILLIDNKQRNIDFANEFEINAILFENVEKLKVDLQKFGVES
jgi:FMN phosphatase YigB (HAD superfamily)